MHYKYYSSSVLHFNSYKNRLFFIRKVCLVSSQLQTESLLPVLCTLNNLVNVMGNVIALKCPCEEKIISPIQMLVKHYLEISQHGVLSFSIFCFVLKIFSFLKHANQVQSDVTYSRILNQIQKTMNIFIRDRNWNSFKLCSSIEKSVSHLRICITAFFMETIKQQMCLCLQNKNDYFFTAKQGLN